MSIVRLVPAGLAALSCLFWLAAAVGALRVARAMRNLRDLSPPAPPRWPRVSLIVPACNEAANVEAAMRARLADDYPDLQVVLVNDRSTDETGAIVDRLAAADPRVRAVHIETLPAGWLGKLHAMHVGLGHADGEWLLFSDADIHWTSGTLRKTVALCEQRGLDHLTLMPSIWPRSFGLDVMMSYFVRMLALGTRVWAVEDPRSPVAIGGGLFNLVRRTAFDRTPGFEWLKLEVADDLALGQMIKNVGGRGTVVNARDEVGLYFYRSLREVVAATDRAGFAVLGRYSVARAFAFALATVLLEAGPFVALLPLGVPGLRALGALGVAALVGISVGLNRWVRRPVVPAALAPLGGLVMAACIVRSAWLGARRGGIVWRGTHYATEVLRAGVRYELH